MNSACGSKARDLPTAPDIWRGRIILNGHHMMKPLSQNALLGLGVIAFGLLLLFVFIPNGISKPSNIRVAVLSPTFWPDIVAWGLVGGGAMLLIQGLFGRALLPDRKDEEPDDDPVPGSPWLRLLGIAIIMAAYYLLIPLLGMVLTSMAVFASLIIVVRSRYRMIGITVAIILPLATYSFFNHVAGVPIPQGQLLRLP